MQLKIDVATYKVHLLPDFSYEAEHVLPLFKFFRKSNISVLVNINLTSFVCFLEIRIFLYFSYALLYFPHSLLYALRC